MKKKKNFFAFLSKLDSQGPINHYSSVINNKLKNKFSLCNGLNVMLDLITKF